jgi:hypothetical protein
MKLGRSVPPGIPGILSGGSPLPSGIVGRVGTIGCPGLGVLGTFVKAGSSDPPGLLGISFGGVPSPSGGAGSGPLFKEGLSEPPGTPGVFVGGLPFPSGGAGSVPVGTSTIAIIDLDSVILVSNQSKLNRRLLLILGLHKKTLILETLPLYTLSWRLSI